MYFSTTFYTIPLRYMYQSQDTFFHLNDINQCASNSLPEYVPLFKVHPIMRHIVLHTLQAASS